MDEDDLVLLIAIVVCAAIAWALLVLLEARERGLI